MNIFEDSFRLADAPQALASRLIDELTEFSHCFAAKVVCVFSERQLFLRGAPAAAFIAAPFAQGAMKHLWTWLLTGFMAPRLAWEEPDYVVLFDRPLWDALDAVGQERLVYHELKHIAQRTDEFGAPQFTKEGTPKLKLIPHDAEYFDDEVTRYGVAVCGLDAHAVAIAEGEARARRRGLKIA